MVVGSPGSAVGDVAIEGMRLNLVRLTDLPGGYRDLRPGVTTCVRGVPDDAVYLEHVDAMRIQDLQVRLSPSASMALRSARQPSLEQMGSFLQAVWDSSALLGLPAPPAAQLAWHMPGRAAVTSRCSAGNPASTTQPSQPW